MKRVTSVIHSCSEKGNRKFLDNWYTKLKDFSMNLIKDIVKFCENTIEETGTLIESAEVPLKKKIEEVVPQNKIL